MLNVPTPRNLLPSTTYCMDVSGGGIKAVDSDGGLAAANAAYCFHTADTMAPNYVQVCPRNGEANITVKSPMLTINFDEPIALNQSSTNNISLVPTNKSLLTVIIKEVDVAVDFFFMASFLLNVGTTASPLKLSSSKNPLMGKLSQL